MEYDRPVFDQVNLVISSMEASVAFYRRLGLQIPDPSEEWPDDHRSTEPGAGISIDFDTAAFAKAWDHGWRGNGARGTGVVLGFRFSSREAVDQMYAELTGAGYRGQQPPYDAFWGARYAIVEDPDENAVGLMSTVDPARRSAVPGNEPAAAGTPAALPHGAEVLDNRGAKFARVGEVSGAFFRLVIPLGADFWLPTSYVASADGEHVHLSISRDDVDQYKLAGPDPDAVINKI